MTARTDEHAATKMHRRENFPNVGFYRVRVGGGWLYGSPDGLAFVPDRPGRCPHSAPLAGDGSRGSERGGVYILAMRNHHYFLIGPFVSHASASDWGRKNNPLDDPRWQTVTLAGPRLAPPVYAPDSPEALHAMADPTSF
jgi:hypothetical protein